MPLRGEGGLRYADWVRRNREYVAEKTGGKIGYIHMPDMGGRGLIEFNTWFYPQLDKEGMVVDCRWNGGGFVSQMMLERSAGTLISFDRARGGGDLDLPVPHAQRPLRGADQRVRRLRRRHLPRGGPARGPGAGHRQALLGRRRRHPRRQAAGGRRLAHPARVRLVGSRPRAGAWRTAASIPDIEVDNLPQELAAGVDAQLDRAIDEVLRLHAENPPIEPDFGPARSRSRKDYRGELGTP